MINLSNLEFTTNEYKLLGYNLNFVPTPDSINKNELFQDVNKFNRRIKLKSHFGNLPKEGLYFKTNSTREPSNTHHTVKTFTEDFSKKISESLTMGSNRGKLDQKNLNKHKILAMENLQERENRHLQSKPSEPEANRRPDLDSSPYQV